MKALLYDIVARMAIVHEKLMDMNNAYETNFTDKQLHFLVIGILGMAMVFVLHPLFLWLAKKKHVLVITWLYVFTVILVITFAIEIGQRVTHTGVMEFADIVFGIGGFLLMFAIFWAIRLIIKGIIKLIGLSKKKTESKNEN
jgi:hypothetical protein